MQVLREGPRKMPNHHHYTVASCRFTRATRVAALLSTRCDCTIARCLHKDSLARHRRARRTFQHRRAGTATGADKKCGVLRRFCLAIVWDLKAFSKETCVFSRLLNDICKSKGKVAFLTHYYYIVAIAGRPKMVDRCLYSMARHVHLF